MARAAAHQKALGLLLDPKMLDAGRIEAANERFNAGFNRHVVLDDFLAASLLAPLQKIAETEGLFASNLKLKSQMKSPTKPMLGKVRGLVSAAEFAEAENANKFINQRRFVGPKPEFAGSYAAKSEAFVRTMLSSTPLHEWLYKLTGIAVSKTGGINLKLHGPGSFLRKHSDTRKDRKLCMVLYLHAEWQADWAGRFILHCAEGRKKHIDPLPNRLILFDVTQDNFHEIEALGPVPEGWNRINYSAWFA